MASDILAARPTAASPVLRDFQFVSPDQVDNSQRTGALALAFYLFLLVSRTPEFFANKFGTSFYQIFAVSIVCIVFVLIGGAKQNLTRGTITAFLLALHAWYTVSIPFSYWRTGSVAELLVVIRFVPAFLFSATLIHNSKQMRTVFSAICAATLMVLVVTLTADIKESDDGRLSLASGSFSNANEIALYLLFGLPFWAYFSSRTSTAVAIRVLISAEIVISLYQCLRTGSRGGLVTMGLLAVLLFYLTNGLGRVKIVLGAALVALLLIPLMPASIKDRLASIFDPGRDASATLSKQGRLDLLAQGIDIAIHHPIAGVGLGVYPEAAAGISESKGEKKKWQVPHNSYAQVASEAGFPALFFYLATLVVSVRAMVRTRRLAASIPEMRDTADHATVLLVVMSVYILNNFFGNNATAIIYYVLCGLILACASIAEREYVYYTALRQARANGGSDPLQPAAAPRRRFGPAATAAQKMPSSANTDTEKNDWTNQYGDAPWARRPPRGR